MASIVSAFGVPRTPFIPAGVKHDGPESGTARLFADVTRHLAESNLAIYNERLRPLADAADLDAEYH